MMHQFCFACFEEQEAQEEEVDTYQIDAKLAKLAAQTALTHSFLSRSHVGALSLLLLCMYERSVFVLTKLNRLNFNNSQDGTGLGNFMVVALVATLWDVQTQQSANRNMERFLIFDCIEFESSLCVSGQDQSDGNHEGHC